MLLQFSCSNLSNLNLKDVVLTEMIDGQGSWLKANETCNLQSLLKSRNSRRYIMKEIFYWLLGCFLLFEVVDCQSDVKILSYTNYVSGRVGLGNVDSRANYLSVQEDPIGSLPDEFTVCSSLHLKNFTTPIGFYQLYKV